MGEKEYTEGVTIYANGARIEGGFVSLPEFEPVENAVENVWNTLREVIAENPKHYHYAVHAKKHRVRKKYINMLMKACEAKYREYARKNAKQQ